jgi:signal transduction histidine kinase
MLLKKRKLFFFFCFFLSIATGHAQLIDLSPAPAYLPVFAATDDLDSSYLTQLEKAYQQHLPDTLKLSVGNDLAYYWHTRNLGESILDTFNAAKIIRINCHIQPLELDVDTAVPIGLIANELLTNALKYAFAANQPGEIGISLSTTGISEELVFRVCDNGIGKPENIIAKGTGFGTELVNLLVQQLGGKLMVDTNNGTSISIYFKYTKQQNG